MNRRAFLSVLAGAAVDPERLLWRPGAKLISIPKPKAATFDWYWPDTVVWMELISIEEFERRYPVRVLPIGARLSDRIWTPITPPIQPMRPTGLARAAAAPMGRVLLETTYIL